ncbi:TetR/AcrR family transcriptional regulator [Streptomyces sp. NPDC058953]|uniref:TetR/AcrR family transcriptional regulator n=1 Tax=unclassified Streptomyces TaxID=2593676 RepID=UPI0036C8E73F
MTPQAQATGRVARRRQATLAEIRATARRLLNKGGPPAVTINAVAREMGMSGPAVYRYYASHDELVEAVIADFYDELTETIVAARDAQPADSHGARLLATCRAMRAWATTHSAEFTWMFASPAPPFDERGDDSPRRRSGQRFERVFFDQTVDVWAVAPFPVPGPGELPDALREQLAVYSSETGGLLPPEAMHVFLSGWIKLYGLLCMEVLRQLDFARIDLEPVFEECLRDLCATHGLEYEPPAAGG